MEFFSGQLGEVAHGVDADKRADLFRISRGPSQHHQTTAALAEQDRLRRPAAPHHLLVKPGKLCGAGWGAAHFAEIEPRDADAGVHQAVKIQVSAGDQNSMDRRRVPDPGFPLRWLGRGVEVGFVSLDREGLRCGRQCVFRGNRDCERDEEGQEDLQRDRFHRGELAAEDGRAVGRSRSAKDLEHRLAVGKQHGPICGGAHFGVRVDAERVVDRRREIVGPDGVLRGIRAALVATRRGRSRASRRRRRAAWCSTAASGRG